MYNRKGRGGEEEAIPLTGDSLGEVVRWKTGAALAPREGRTLLARLSMENATAYAWQLRLIE